MYIGRFAPTPSGRLHLGSLIALTGAYLRAKSQQGLCLLRIEDLDKPRCSKEATAQLLTDVKQLGFSFDGEVLVQSRREQLARYQRALESLRDRGYTYYCACSRSSRKQQPCSCARLNLPQAPTYALCFNASALLEQSFYDELQGRLELTKLPTTCTLIRRDQIIAYNLACVVDDHDSGVTEVVRGSDLIEQTPLQNALYEALGWTPPRYLHLPLLMQESGLKFSKQNHAPAVLESFSPQQALLVTLGLLGQSVQGLERVTDCAELLSLAALRFDITKIPVRPQYLSEAR